LQTVQKECDHAIVKIRSDQGDEFENENFELFCDEYGIEHTFSAPRTSQQNSVIERKNRTINELAHTLLNSCDLPKYFLSEAINTACHVLNRVLIQSILKKTPYELYYQKIPNILYFRILDVNVLS